MEIDEIINNVQGKVNLNEGKSKIFEMIIILYENSEGLSNKELSRKLFIPIPLVSALKKEMVKEDIVIVKNRMQLTQKGIDLINNYYEFDKIDRNKYYDIIKNREKSQYYQEILSTLEKIMLARPSADVTLDQAKSTGETSLNRVLLALKYNSIFRKSILCLGDDDLVSINIVGAINNLKLKKSIENIKISVFDIDQRILDYISNASNILEYKINLKKMNFCFDLSGELKNSFQTIFLDPPYTFKGLELFLTRAVELLDKTQKSYIFLSFLNREDNFNYEIQKLFINLGLVTEEIVKDFNEYEGAEIIGNKSQMIVLSNTKYTKSISLDEEMDKIYTGKQNITYRKYRCKNCGKIYKIGEKQKIRNIEELKINGCSCSSKKFIRIGKEKQHK